MYIAYNIYTVYRIYIIYYIIYGWGFQGFVPPPPMVWVSQLFDSGLFGSSLGLSISKHRLRGTVPLYWGPHAHIVVMPTQV